MQQAAEREYEAGQTLLELERRQDDVLSQLDDLDQKLTSILRGLGVTMSDDDAAQPSLGIRLADLGDDCDGEQAYADADSADGESDDDRSAASHDAQLAAIIEKRRRAA